MTQEKTITVSYRPTVDEVLRAERIHSRVSTKWWHWLGVAILGIVLLTSAVIQYRLAAIPTWYTIITVLVLVVLIPGALCIRQWLLKRTAARSLESMSGGGEVVQYVIDAEAVRSRVEDLAEGSEKWAAFARVVRTNEGLLLYRTEHTYYWLPNHAFESPEDADALADIARQYAPRYVDSTR